MEFQKDHAIEILSRTPRTIAELVGDLSDTWLLQDEGPETWSPFDILGHLIHGEETDWITRAKIILEDGESRPFEPFDRFAMFEASKGKSVTELLETFKRLRGNNLIELGQLKLTEEMLDKRGRHPELGVVTLKQFARDVGCS